MTNKIQESLWRQFGASIDMLINVISTCPDNYLATNKTILLFSIYSAVFLDYYLSIPPKDFSPILTFTIKDKDQRPPESIGDMIPDKIYSKQELIDYLKNSRLKCKKIIGELTDNEKLNIRLPKEIKKATWTIQFWKYCYITYDILNTILDN